MDPLPIACELVSVPSVSSDSNIPVAEVTAQWMSQCGFSIERRQFIDPHGVTQVNLVGKKGTGTGGLAYFGHNDVVPVDTWNCPGSGPFTPTVRNGRLYGRGSCDMKGSVAAFLAAAGRMPAESLREPIYFICTADEEIGLFGAEEVARNSPLYREIVVHQTAGLIGEPTELEIVYAHKGSYSFRAVSRGRAAHSSTREGRNANWAMIPFLNEMQAIYQETLTDPAWLNPEFDPPDISVNMSITDNAPALNIKPSESVCRFGFRPMPGQSPDQILERARQAAAGCGLEFEMYWQIPPVRTDPDSPFVQRLLRLADKQQARTVSYGTDGSCFTEIQQLVVLGPGSIKQAHTDDEWIALEQLHAGADLYERLILSFCGRS